MRKIYEPLFHRLFKKLKRENQKLTKVTLGMIKIALKFRGDVAVLTIFTGIAKVIFWWKTPTK